MRNRVLTAIFGILLIFLVNFFGGIYLKVFLLAVSVIAISELLKTLNIENEIIALSIITSSIIIINNIIIYDYLIVFLSFLIVTSYYVVKNNISAKKIVYVVFSFAYIPITLGLLYYLRGLEKGDLLIWLPYMICWGVDTFAFFIGINFGKNKLCSNISPKKSVEGFFGGLLGGLIAVVLFEFIYNRFELNTIYIFKILFISIVVSITAQIGDLFASMIKRENNKKDFGWILPGHGGVLDRFDSLLLVTPLVYLLRIINII
ncbi:phosphatidate cytidylyltransferase [Caldicellulosiruptoraceae bacterium PP1]